MIKLSSITKYTVKLRINTPLKPQVFAGKSLYLDQVKNTGVKFTPTLIDIILRFYSVWTIQYGSCSHFLDIHYTLFANNLGSP